MSELPIFTPEAFDLGDGAIMPAAEIIESGHVLSAAYTSADRFAEEAALFGRIWLNIAEEDDLPRPGDWVVRTVACRSASILLWRDAMGVVRAFHNVCRHRGMQLAWEDSGTASRLTCPYHAWTYADDGALKAVPDEICFPGLDRGTSGLQPITLAIWEGFIFINLDPQPKQSFEAFIAPVAERFQDLPFRNFPQRVTIRQTLKTNWKLALEAQSESYHIRALHSRTVSGMISSGNNPFCHPLFWRALGPHRTWSTAINPDYTLSPARPVQRYAFMHSAQLVGASDGAAMDAKPGFQGPQPFDRGDPALWGSDQLVIYPHFALNAGSNGCWMHRFWPVSANETAWEGYYYYRAPATVREVFAQEYALAFNRDTLSEDNGALERQQAALGSGAVPFVQFGRQEMMCRHNAAVTEAAVNPDAQRCGGDPTKNRAGGDRGR
jgi:phenylpropionate dioxygenase-like ring-hydroxylating dioxygenase large terminal subunit